MIDQLYTQAKELLEHGDFRQARDLGHQLLKARFSGAFEILAASFRGEGALDVAITVLENGTKEAPGVWPLWMQLGNYLSEAGKLNEAVQAYQKARACPGSDQDQIDFNEAYMRMCYGNKERCLELFARVIKETEDRRLRLVALKHRLCTLIDLDQVTGALMELGDARLHDADNAELLTTLSLKLLDTGDKANALNLARQALGLKRAGKAARVLRKLEGEPCERCDVFRVIMRGHIDDDDKRHSFLKTSEVYAESEEEAGKLAVDFEPPDVRPDLSIEEVTKQGQAIGEPKGVDWSSGLMLFEDGESP